MLMLVSESHLLQWSRVGRHCSLREECGGKCAQEVRRHAHGGEGDVVVVEEEEELEQCDGVLAQPTALLANLPLLRKRSVNDAVALLAS